MTTCSPATSTHFYVWAIALATPAFGILTTSASVRSPLNRYWTWRSSWISVFHDLFASVTGLCCGSFADCDFFLQIFGGVEDTHKTLVKKVTQKTPERDKEDKEKEEERGSSVYDSRSSLRRWLENRLSIRNQETCNWLLLFLVIGQNSCHIDDQLWQHLPLMYLCNNCQLWDRLKTNFSARFFL